MEMIMDAEMPSWLRKITSINLEDRNESFREK